MPRSTFLYTVFVFLRRGMLSGNMLSVHCRDSATFIYAKRQKPCRKRFYPSPQLAEIVNGPYTNPLHTSELRISYRISLTLIIHTPQNTKTQTDAIHKLTKLQNTFKDVTITQNSLFTPNNFQKLFHSIGDDMTSPRSRLLAELQGAT